MDAGLGVPARCVLCGGESPHDASFCIHCGAPLAVEGGGREGVGAGAQGPGPSVEREVRDLGRALSRLSDRVAALESLQGAAPRRPERSGVPPQPASADPTPASPGPQPSQAPVAPPPPTQWGAAPPSPPGAAPFRLPMGLDWERVLGVNWLAVVGAVALAIGVGFFLRLAFENDWIGETGRVVLGLVVGVGLLGVGEYTQRRYPAWAQAVIGAGIGVLYLSIYAAFGFYGLMPPLPAFLFLALVVALSGVLALRYESLAIALLGTFGAFLTPLLMGSDLADHRLFLAYLVLVDLGILGVAALRGWRWLTLLGLLGSYLLFSMWAGRLPESELLLAQAGLTGVFLVFVGATTLFHLAWRRKPGEADMALMTLNAAAYFALTFGLLWDGYRAWFGTISLGLALFYGMVGYGAIRRSGAPPEVALFALATAMVFLTLAVPLQLSGSWITIAWSAEGAVLVAVGFALGSRPLRAFALGVFAVAAFRLVFLDTPLGVEGFRPVLNPRFLTFAVAVAALYMSAYLYRRHEGQLAEWEAQAPLALAGAANLFTLWLLSAEVVWYFDARELAARRAGSALGAAAAEGDGLAALTFLWAVYAMGLLGVAGGRRSAALRWGGVGLAALAGAKLLLVDTFAGGPPPASLLPVLNLRFAPAVAVVVALAMAALVYRRQRDGLQEWERYLLPALMVAANLVAVWSLSVEALRYLQAREARLGADYASARHLTLTVLWAVYAIGVIGVGIARQSRAVRLAGIGLLALPVAKLFVFDVFLLERGYRVAAFVTLGVLLLSTGLVYQRYSHAIRGFLFGKAR